MSRTFIQKIIGLILLLMGSIVLSGWILHVHLMVEFKTGLVAMVFNTAMCFTLTGIVLILRNFSSKFFVGLQIAIPTFIFALCAATFVEILFDIKLGIDWPSLHTWIGDGNIKPGRMAPNTALGFITIALTLLLSIKVEMRWQARAIQVLTFLVLLIGFTGLVGYILAPDLLYGWARSARMALHTASGMILVGIALWVDWHNAEWYRSDRLFREDQKMEFIAIAILAVVTLTAGGIGFVLLQPKLEQTLHQRLLNNFEYRVALYHTALEQAQTSSATLVQQLRVVDMLGRIRAHRDEREIVTEFKTALHAILSQKIEAIAIYDNAGDEQLLTGHFAQLSRFSVKFESPFSGTLVWDDQLHVQTETIITENANVIGKLVVQYSLASIDKRLFNISDFGVSGEAVLCRGIENNLLCLSEARNPKVFTISRFTQLGKPLPMSFAIDGNGGVVEAQDYRGNNVVAAFGPLAANLGLVVKQDSAEMYSQIRMQFKIASGLLALLLLAGAGLLRSQLKPLARRLVASETAAVEKEKQISILLNSVDEGIITIDEKGIIHSFNPAASHIFGYSTEAAVGQNITLLMPGNMRDLHNLGMDRYLRDGNSAIVGHRGVELPGLRKDGSTFSLELSVSEMNVNVGRRFVGIVRDITARKQAADILFAEKEWLHVTLHSIGDAVITTDTEGNVTYLNPIAENMTGWSNSDAMGKSIHDVFCIINELTQQPAVNPVDTVLINKAAATLEENTLLIKRNSDTKFPIEDSAAPIRNREGIIIGVVLVFHDVTHAKKMAAEMSFQATHDPLTGLINRREFEKRLESSLRSGKLEHKIHSLLYLDLDQFKIVNDTCGHIAGDELLRQLSSVLLTKLRQTDTLARLGGDEFGVLLDSCDTEVALRIAETLRATVNTFHFVWKDKSFSIGVTIGLVSFSNDGVTLADILRMADSACYIAKEKGRDRVQVYLQENQEFENHHGQMGWVSRIRDALDQQRFVLYSQTILALGEASETKKHHEILIRMRDENGTIVPPMAFIPAAERYGLMNLIDRWVVSTTFAQYKNLQEGDGATHTCAINLSGATLCDESFLEFVLTQFKKYPVPPENICFEITETVAIANLTQAINLIQELRAIGCSFALDDFGSGMSSFSYLKHLPVNYLKIDGGFVKGIIDNPIDRAMVESINNIGHVMGIQTIAEFVENDQILKMLRVMGVDFAQGYEIQKPIPFAPLV